MPVYEVTYDLPAGTPKEYESLRDRLTSLIAWNTTHRMEH
jgi:hypothetical protein